MEQVLAVLKNCYYLMMIVFPDCMSYDFRRGKVYTSYNNYDSLWGIITPVTLIDDSLMGRLII